MEKNYISIKNWAEGDRPREKLLSKGPASLSDAELLALLISSGTKERSAIDLARDILMQAHNNLHELGRLSIVELQQTKGIGEARAITIAAAMEFGRRRQMGEVLQRSTIQQSREAAEIVIPLMRDLNHEVFCVLYLNQANRLIRHELISSGGITGTVADIRIILKNALLYNSNQLIVSHNHPSGNLQPSQADKELTRKLREAAALMDIKLLDHLIVAGVSYLSLSDEGFM
ncbi:MAG: JAB domain-containing protein [Sphingobacteriales bacterium]|nr:MAG: JAB domain-containing protein [Sphingobacteriales bacterium]